MKVCLLRFKVENRLKVVDELAVSHSGFYVSSPELLE